MHLSPYNAHQSFVLCFFIPTSLSQTQIRSQTVMMMSIEAMNGSTTKRAEKSAARVRKHREKAAEERRRAEVADRQKSSRQNKRKKDLDGVDARERKRKSRKMKSDGLPPNDEEGTPQNDADHLAESHLNSVSCFGGSNGLDELLESLNKITLLPENFSEQLPEEVRAAAKKHFVGMSATDDSGEVHKAPVCVVCDRFTSMTM